MTSKNSWFDMGLLGQLFKRLNWLVALYSALCFFSVLVPSVFLLQELQRLNRLPEQIGYQMAGMFSTDNQFLFFFAFILAIVAAAALFSFLNVKSQVDFYHAQPVRRETFFCTRTLAGMLAFLIPYLISTVLALAVVAIGGYWGFLDPTGIGKLVLCVVLCYLLSFLLAQLAFVLCGNTAVALAGVAVFTFIGPLLSLLYEGTMEIFYDTYLLSSLSFTEMARKSSVLFYFMTTDFDKVSYPWFCFGNILLIAGLLVLNLSLFVRRRSESAGKAIAFRPVRLIVKLPILAAGTVSIAYLFYSIGYEKLPWLIFGGLCGCFLTHAVVEIIYAFDFKALRLHWKSSLAVFVALCLLLSIPVFDLTGFDERLSRPEDTKAASIYFRSGFSRTDYCSPSRYDYSRFLGQEFPDFWEISSLDRFAFDSPEAIDLICRIASDAVAAQKEKSTMAETNTYGVNIRMTPHKGGAFYRSYWYDTGVSDDAIRGLFNLAEFKRAYFDFLFVRDAVGFSTLGQMKFTHLITQKTDLVTDPDRLFAVAEALETDLMALDAEYLRNHTPILLVDCQYRYPGAESDRTYWVQVPVYSNFENTLPLLREYGVGVEDQLDASVVDCLYIQVEPGDESDEQMKAGVGAVTVELSDQAIPPNPVFTITDPARIQQILELTASRSALNASLLYGDEVDFSYTVTAVSSRYNNGYNETFYFTGGRTPTDLAG